MPTESIRLMDHHFYLFICSRLIENRNVHHRQNKINNNNEKSVCQVVKVLKTRWTISEPEKKQNLQYQKFSKIFYFLKKKLNEKKTIRKSIFSFHKNLSIVCTKKIRENVNNNNKNKQSTHRIRHFLFFLRIFRFSSTKKKMDVFLFPSSLLLLLGVW